MPFSVESSSRDTSDSDIDELLHRRLRIGDGQDDLSDAGPSVGLRRNPFGRDNDDDRVPVRIYTAYKNQESINILGDVGESLTVSNYRAKFQLLLWWEEMKQADDKSKCNEQNVSVQRETEEERRKRQEGRDHIEFLDSPCEFKLRLERNPTSLKSMDELKLMKKRGVDSYRGTIVKVQAKFVYFTLNTDREQNSRSIELDFNCELKYDVEFSINRTPLSRCHAALIEFSTNLMLQGGLFPAPEAELSKPLINASDLRAPTSCHSYLRGKTLNDSQRLALIGILESRCRPSPHILFGPPGTGKTATIVEAILQIHKRKPLSKILVCGTSNDSTDVLARALFTSGAILPHEFVRLSAAYRIGRDAPRDLKSVTVDITQLKEDWKHGKRYSIYVTTCSQSVVLEDLTFDYVIVDEAGSAKEPEALIPLIRLKVGGAAILAGDPKQLGPSCQSEEANNYGLGLSLLERLYQYKRYGEVFDAHHISILNVCYRGPERLFKVNNELFYHNKLSFPVETSTEWLNRMGFPSSLLFVSCSSDRHMKQPGGTSLYNDGEAKVAAKLVRRLYNSGVRSEEVGIVSPYRGQVIHLMKMFKELQLRYCKIETTEKFQGDERDVMLITTVRSACGEGTSKFSRDPCRFNVATSRAKKLMILIGDPQQLKQDERWSRFIENATEITI